MIPVRLLRVDGTHRRPIARSVPRRDLDDDWFDGPLSTATTVLEYEPEPLGVLMVDHRGNPLLARVRDTIGYHFD